MCPEQQQQPARKPADEQQQEQLILSELSRLLGPNASRQQLERAIQSAFRRGRLFERVRHLQ